AEQKQLSRRFILQVFQKCMRCQQKMMHQNKHLNLLTVIGMVLSCLKEPVCCCLKIMSTLKHVVLILLVKLSATVARQMHIISPTPLLMGHKKQCSWQSNEQAFMHKTLITSMHMG